MRKSAECRWVVPFLVLATFAGPAPAGAAAPKLHYGFEPGRKYVYEVKIVATFDEATETREGLSTYTAKAATGAEFVLVHSGSLGLQRKSTASRPPWAGPDFARRFPWSDFVSARAGEFTLSPVGKVIKAEVETGLPYMLGYLQYLPIEEFPAEARTKWEQRREVSITEREPARFPRGPFAPAEATGPRRAAQETVAFAIASTAGSTVRIKRDYVLRSLEKVESDPRLELVGEGELVFDTKEGVFQSCSMKYTFRVNETNLSLKIPLTVSCRLLAAQELEQRLKAQEASRVAAQAAAAKANEPKPLAAGEREKLLKDLRMTDEWAVRGAADRLAKAPADAQPEPVAEALGKLLSDRSSWIRAAAAKALVNWATSNSVPALIKAVEDTDLWVRKAAMDALGRQRTPATAKAVAARLVEMQDRGDAVKALKTMGPVAEPEVLPYLKDRDGWVQLEACKLLGDIGTAKSVPDLEAYGASGKPFSKDEAEKAVKAIKGRE